MVILSLSLILNAFAWQGKPYDILQRGPLFSSFSVGFFSALPPHSQHQNQYSTRGEAVSRNTAASARGSDSSRRRTVPSDVAASIETFRGGYLAAHSQGRLRKSMPAAAADAGAKEPVISGSENVMDGEQSEVGSTDAEPADNTTARLVQTQIVVM